jgi:TRAP-type C4-dicarboxylate transport system substrate-binding protein
MKVKRIRASATVVSLICVMVLSCILAASSTCARAASPVAKQINLKFAMFFPPVSQQAKLWEEYCKEVEKQTGGTVKISYYAGGTLLGPDRVADGTRDGVTDIGLFQILYHPGKFPVSEAATVPGYPTAWVGTHVVDDFWREFKPKELDRFHVLTAATHGPMIIWSQGPIQKLEDLKGKRLRVQGLAADIVTRLGGTPLNLPAGDIYDAMMRGLLDGTIFPFETARTWRLAEVSKYVIDAGSIFNFGIFYTVMNKSKWDGLPKDIQTIIDKVSREWVERSARMWNQNDVEGAELARSRELKFMQLSAEERARWMKAVQPVIDQYVKDMTGRGFPEKEVKGYLDYVKARTDYWLKKQIESGIKSATGPAEVRIK